MLACFDDARRRTMQSNSHHTLRRSSSMQRCMPGAPEQRFDNCSARSTASAERRLTAYGRNGHSGRGIRSALALLDYPLDAACSNAPECQWRDPGNSVRTERPRTRSHRWLHLAPVREHASDVRLGVLAYAHLQQAHGVVNCRSVRRQLERLIERDPSIVLTPQLAIQIGEIQICWMNCRSNRKASRYALSANGASRRFI